MPELLTPAAEGLLAHGDASFDEELFDIAVAQQEAGGEPHGMADALAGNALPLVASRRVLQRGVLRHSPDDAPVS